MKKTLLTVFLLAPIMLFAQQNSLDHLLKDSATLADPGNLTIIPATFSTAFVGKTGESGFGLHSYLQFFQGKYFLIWSSSRVHEEDPDQHILYSTSTDGHHWSPALTLAADPDGPTGPQRWITRGLFIERGHLYALGAFVASADYKNQGNGVVWRDLRLVRFLWTGKTWKEDGTFAEDCMNNFPPQRYGGRYVMPCRDSSMRLVVAVGEPGNWKRIGINAAPPFNRMDEPTLYRAKDGSLQLIIRDGSRSHFLLRAVSTDNGNTWQGPVRTNYPDATSKNFATPLSNGLFVLINNPNPQGRDPLAISVSADGWVYQNPRAIRKGTQMNDSSAKWSFQYPYAIEHNGSLWITYSINKRDIEVCQIKLSDLSL